MRKLLLLSLAGIGVLFLAPAGSAEGACKLKCLNKKVNNLSRQLAQAEATISQQNQQINAQTQRINGNTQALDNLIGCLAEAPLTQYGDPPDDGYVFDQGMTTFNTTALDLTESGDPIGGWALFDACNPQTVANVAGQASANAIAPQTGGLFPNPERRVP
jgi:hypothetical protein